MTAGEGGGHTAPAGGMTRWTGGFARPWVEWDGRVGEGREAGVVLVDGRPIPVTSTTCDVSTGPEQHHEPGHDHCRSRITKGPLAGHVSDPTGFSFTLHLENGLVLEGLVGDDTSVLIAQVGVDGLQPSVTIKTADGTPYAEVCRSECCKGGQSWHMSSSWQFETYEELMGRVSTLSRLEVRDEARPPSPPQARPQRPERHPYGTITLEEWRLQNGATS